MSKDLNKVMITGRLGADPETRVAGTSNVTNLRVASSRTFVTNGEKREKTEWFSVVAWNQLADICAQYLRKGSRVYFEGRLETRSWEDTASGQTKYKTELIAEEMIILDSANSGNGGDEGETVTRQPAPKSVPTGGRDRAAGAMGRTVSATRPAAAKREPVDEDISEDDLPF